MFMVSRDGDAKPTTFDDLDKAIAWGREREAFAVYDEEDAVVFQEWPQAQHRRH